MQGLTISRGDAGAAIRNCYAPPLANRQIEVASAQKIVSEVGKVGDHPNQVRELLGELYTARAIGRWTI